MLSLARHYILAFVILATLPAFGRPARADDMQLRVAAVVNDEAITVNDFEERMKLTLISSNLPDNAEVRHRIGGQVLRKLIDEHIETQEARRLKLTISPDEIRRGESIIERQNNLPPNTFEAALKNRGINPNTVRQQIRAEIAWVKVIRAELVPEVRIGEEEIDARMATLRANLGKPEYLAAEIFLPVDKANSDEEARTLAMRLIEQMQRGAPFSALARQFSSNGASAGGDLGWVSRGMLDDDLMARLEQLDKGHITPPIRLADGYHILLLRDKRIAGQSTQYISSVDAVQASREVLASTSDDERREQIKTFLNGVSGSKTCEEFERRARQSGATATRRTGMVELNELGEWAAVLKDMKPGQISQPITHERTTRIVMLCRRDDPTGGLPSRAEVRRRLEDERVDLMSRRYMRDLRRQAFVEIRM